MTLESWQTSFATQATGGLWWQVAGASLCIIAGVLDAWVLLVEILR